MKMLLSKDDGSAKLFISFSFLLFLFFSYEGSVYTFFIYKLWLAPFLYKLALFI